MAQRPGEGKAGTEKRSLNPSQNWTRLTLRGQPFYNPADIEPAIASIDRTKLSTQTQEELSEGITTGATWISNRQERRQENILQN